MTRPDHPNLAILTIGLGAWLFMLAGGITNIALPYLSEELGVAESEIVWTTVAFQIAAVSFTIPFAGLSDIVGVRNMYVGGLIVFGTGSILCGLSGDFTQLVLARSLQGLGAAGISSVNAALVRRCAPELALGRVLGLLALIVGAAQGAAPIIGSAILGLASWRWLFLYDFPLTVLAVLLALYAVPGDQRSTHRFDYLSAALCVPTLGLGFLALDRIARAPTNALPYAYLAVAVISGVLLVMRQKGRARPLFPVDLFVLARISLPAGISALMYGAQGVALTALPFLFMSTLNLTLLQAGALISVMPLATLFAAPISGLIADRFPRLALSTIGCLLMAVGFAGISLAAMLHDRLFLTFALIVLGAGFAAFQNHNSKVMILAAPVARMGAAGGIQSTSRVVGIMIGPALVGICFHAFGDAAPAIAPLIGIALALVGAGLGLLNTLLDRRAAMRG